MLGIESIQITPRIMKRASQIDQFKGLWLGLETYTTGLQILSDVAAHGAKVQRVLSPLKDKAITTDIIKILHAMQTGGQGMSAYKAGENQMPMSKGHQVFGTLDAAAPDQVEPLMNKLVGWLNDSLDGGDMHPLIVIAVFTSVFLQIAPFETGNFRAVRFLILLLLLKSDYRYAPFVPLDRIMEERAQEIYEALAHNQKSLEEGRPDWGQWLSCFFDLLVEQADILSDRLDSKEKDLSKLPTLSARVMKLFEEHDRLQMKDIVKLTRGRRSTLKLRLGELVDDGYLRRHGQARSTWYSQI